MTRRDALIMLAAVIIIAGLALFGARYRDEPTSWSGWRDLERVDAV